MGQEGWTDSEQLVPYTSNRHLKKNLNICLVKLKNAKEREGLANLRNICLKWAGLGWFRQFIEIPY